VCCTASVTFDGCSKNETVTAPKTSAPRSAKAARLSIRCRKRQDALSDGFRSEEQRFAEVLGFEIRIECENILCRLALSNEGDDRGDRNPEATQARDPSHLAGIGRDSLEFHGDPFYPLRR